MTAEIDSLKSWFKGFALGAVLVLLALLVLGGVALNDQRTKDGRREGDRIERSIEACLNYNKDQTNDRTSFIESIPEMAKDFFGETTDEIQELRDSKGYTQYQAFIAITNPYRQCSRACVAAETDPDIDNCLPSDSEDGSAPQSKEN